MIIEDEELRGIFKTSSEEQLQNLDNGLLHLEKYPDDLSVIESLMRDAHSLKGDSNMLGLKEVGTLAHQMEHILSQLKQQQITFSHDMGDRLSYGITAIRQLIQAAITGEPVAINTFNVLSVLMGGKLDDQAHSPTQTGIPTAAEAESQGTTSDAHHPGKSAEQASGQTMGNPLDPSLEPVDLETHGDDVAVPLAPLDDALEVAVTQVQTIAADLDLHLDVHPNLHPDLHPPDLHMQVAPDVVTASNSDGVDPAHLSLTVANSTTSQSQALSTPYKATAQNYQIETIRITTRSLDNLMTQVGELTVTKIRIAHRLAEIESLANLWDEWSRKLLHDRHNAYNAPAHNAPVQSALANKSLASKPQSRMLSLYSPAVNTHSLDLHGRADEQFGKIDALISNLRKSLYEDATRLELIGDELEEGIRTLRLLPLSTIFHLLPRMVRDLARQEGKQIELIIEGGETRADKRVLEEMKDPLMHLIRNAIDHGIELPSDRQRAGKPSTATIHIRSYQTPTSIVIEIQDDGHGLDLERIKHIALKRGICREEDLATMPPSDIQSLIFTPGFSTAPLVTEVSGRGVGLDVVRTNVEKLKGTVQVESERGQGCLFRIQLGITLATAHVLIVSVHDTPYAIPVEFVRTACLVKPEDLFTLEGRDTIVRDGQPLSVANLADLLELSSETHSQALTQLAQQKQTPCIILQSGREQLGVLVDELIDEQDVVIKPQSKLLKRVRNVSGATILGTGDVCVVLNPQDLIKSVQRRSVQISIAPTNPGNTKKPTILLVEDSIATRTQEKRMLESAGYEVITAVDGNDGWKKLQTQGFDAVISDVQMPNLDGFELTEKIRQQRKYNELPVILVTSLASDADKRRGAEAGANAYITKNILNQEILVETLQRLI